MLSLRRLTGTAALLAALVWASTAHAEPVAVSVDFAQLDSKTYELVDGYALHKLVVLRLVQEGFAVIAPAENPQVRLVLTREGEELLLDARSASTRQQRRVKYPGTAPAELHIEIAHRLASLARTCAPQAPSPPPTGAALPSETKPRHAQLTAGVSALWRSSAVDVLPRVGLRAGIHDAWGVRVELSFDAARSSGLRIFEVQPQAGPSLQVDLKEWLQLELSVLLGALVHVYRMDDPSLSDPSGMVADFLGTVPLSLTFWPHPALGVELRAAAALASSGRRHDGTRGTLWERGPMRVEAGLGAHWRF